jgi:hypothetical protein
MQQFSCYSKAWEGIYFPGTFQIAEYCTNKNHLKCPFLARDSDRNTGEICRGGALQYIPADEASAIK